MFKSFDDLIIEFDISYKDRKKYNTLFENVINRGLLDDFSDQDFDIFNIFSNNIILAPKVPRYTYYIMLKELPPEKFQNIWEIFLLTLEIMWMLNGMRYITVILSVLLKHNFALFILIALNSFLFKIGRKDSPLCSFCSKSPETMLHVFCGCEKVRPI